jgi:hypothetical protein
MDRLANYHLRIVMLEKTLSIREGKKRKRLIFESSSEEEYGKNNFQN